MRDQLERAVEKRLQTDSTIQDVERFHFYKTSAMVYPRNDQKTIQQYTTETSCLCRHTRGFNISER